MLVAFLANVNSECVLLYWSICVLEDINSDNTRVRVDESLNLRIWTHNILDLLPTGMN